MRRSSVVIVCALLVAVLAARAEALHVMGFGGASNWPLFVAQDQGYFAREGLDVEFATARDSADQLARLMDGRIDVALTAFDNVVAHRDGQAGATNAGDREIAAVFGVNHGARAGLFAAPRFTAVGQLRGARIGVDALATGYAFLVEEMLSRGGARDWRLVSVGGSPKRWQALRSGAVDAALLNSPLDAVAEAAGFPRLASADEVAPRYQGSVGAVRRSWARAHEQALVRFIRAFVAAMDWLGEPGHAGQARAILRAHEEGLSEGQARRAYAELLDPARGSLSPRAAMDTEGAIAVLRLRSAHARPAREPGPLERYYDPAYYRRALEAPR